MLLNIHTFDSFAIHKEEWELLYLEMFSNDKLPLSMLKMPYIMCKVGQVFFNFFLEEAMFFNFSNWKNSIFLVPDLTYDYLDLDTNKLPSNLFSTQ